MISILYNNLKTLISASSLVPEEQYRITDYVTTVSKANYTSAGYKFDIVVTALTTNTLYEYATLMANATETYFDVDALLLYNVKYNVNNIIPGYYNDWVDATGKGCIYYMSDDKGNEAPFDFKNIKYNGKFLFNNTLDGTDTSQSVSEYNSVKEVIEDDAFFIPLVSFNNECNNVSIDINAEQVSIYTCSNLQIGKSCYNSIFATVNNVVVGNDFVNSDLDIIDGGEIGNNNNGIIATNQTNLIIKDNNTSVTLGGGNNYLTIGNGVIIDSNNTNVIVGTIAKDVYVNDSKTINLGNNIEQFNISGCYDVVVANDCKLFTLNQTNHLTSETLCNSITCNYNDYVTIKNGIENIYVTEGIDNIILDGNQIDFSEYKTLTIDDVNYIVNDTTTGESWILNSDGTLSANPNGKLIDAPSDGDIYGRKDGDWVKVTGGGNALSIEWLDLKALRDAGTLTPGQSYRIIDYTTTTSQANTSAAGNDFDIITTALDESTLSENAGAIQREGTTYFDGRKLSAWQIKYNLDNDTTKFVWANTSTGKGVIYYMKDEHNNECPYDFKNIKFTKNSTSIYTFGGTTDSTNQTATVIYNNTIKPYIFNSKYELGFNTYGTMCRNNFLDFNCKNNTFGTLCSNNVFGTGCEDNNLGEQSSSNIFGVNCKNNTATEQFISNTFGINCSDNAFGLGCRRNNFIGDCKNNTFASYCSTNVLKDVCSYIQLGDTCYANTFETNCVNNIFGKECHSNVFGKWSDNNRFGNACVYITFGNGCNNNTFIDSCAYIRFGHNCYNNKLGSACDNILYEDSCKHNYFYNGTIASPGTIKNYLLNITLEQASSYNNFYSDTITNNSEARLKMIRIRVSGTQVGILMLNTQITNTTLNRTNELLIARNTAGDVKQYCLEDLIP